MRNFDFPRVTHEPLKSLCSAQSSDCPGEHTGFVLSILIPKGEPLGNAKLVEIISLDLSACCSTATTSCLTEVSIPYVQQSG